MGTTPQPETNALRDGGWIADQRDQGASWIDIAVELNITETEARRLEGEFLDHIESRRRELQHTLW